MKAHFYLWWQSNADAPAQVYMQTAMSLMAGIQHSTINLTFEISSLDRVKFTYTSGSEPCYNQNSILTLRRNIQRNLTCISQEM